MSDKLFIYNLLKIQKKLTEYIAKKVGNEEPAISVTFYKGAITMGVIFKVGGNINNFWNSCSGYTLDKTSKTTMMRELKEMLKPIIKTYLKETKKTKKRKK